MFGTTRATAVLSTTEEYKQTVQCVDVLRVRNGSIDIMCAEKSCTLSFHEDEEVKLLRYGKV
jgi:hypothetical protein